MKKISLEIRVSVQMEWDGLSFGLGLEQTWAGHNKTLTKLGWSTDPHVYVSHLKQVHLLQLLDKTIQFV